MVVELLFFTWIPVNVLLLFTWTPVVVFLLFTWTSVVALLLLGWLTSITALVYSETIEKLNYSNLVKLCAVSVTELQPKLECDQDKLSFMKIEIFLHLQIYLKFKNEIHIF